jgi:hypothetical protein
LACETTLFAIGKSIGSDLRFFDVKTISAALVIGISLIDSRMPTSAAD